jgi:pantoate--beta-alanine ligase
MQVIERVKDLIEKREAYKRAGESIGFVPTMGALHKGHVSLVAQSKKENKRTIVSIFVNPTQFTNQNDLKNYPRTLNSDLDKLKPLNVDIVFAPAVDEMYSKEDANNKVDFDFGEMENVMEGKYRPGHFKGVAQIVSKLFEMVKPDKAYFGEKDFQQLAVIRQLTKQKKYAIEIIGCATVREADGLAMSSRNALLTEEHRMEAAKISKALFFIRDNRKTFQVDELKQKAINMIEESGKLKTEYLEIADEETLKPINDWNDAKHVRAFASVKAGNVRLIDNVPLNTTFAA